LKPNQKQIVKDLIEKDGKLLGYGDLVQYGQEKYVKIDKNATIVRTTKNYKYSDRWHYNSNGFKSHFNP
jgi:hypothetical protein